MTADMGLGRKLELFLLDLLYPNACPCCGKSLPWQAYLCETCQTELLAYPADAFCSQCGKPVHDCICGEGLAYDRAVALTVYEGAARKGVLSMKSAVSLQFGRFCGAELGKRILANDALSGYDMVAPVPMSRRKQLKRCCNPAAVLAKEVAAITRIPYRKDLLHDNGTGRQQHTLSAAQRRENTGQFSAGTVSLKGCRILLCDDVLTTGSTMNRGAALLKAQGAAEVAAVAATTTQLKKTEPDD